MEDQRSSDGRPDDGEPDTAGHAEASGGDDGEHGDGHSRSPEERAQGGVATDGPRGEQESAEEAQEILEEVEQDPPADPRDWPGGRAKYLTIGGDNPAGEYEDGPEANLGPPDLRRHADGSVTIKGEAVDNPEDYKGDPIPGGPTDPDQESTEGPPPDVGADDR